MIILFQRPIILPIFVFIRHLALAVSRGDGGTRSVSAVASRSYLFLFLLVLVVVVVDGEWTQGQEPCGENESEGHRESQCDVDVGSIAQSGLSLMNGLCIRISGLFIDSYHI